MSQIHSYPIILAHGIACFDVLTASLLGKLNLFLWDMSLAFDRLHYFKGSTSYLGRHGYDVHNTNVSFAAGVEKRATELAVQIRQILAKTGHGRQCGLCHQYRHAPQ